MDVDAALGVLLALLLVLANAFFVAAEYAFVRVRKTQLDELAPRSARARRAAGVVDRLDAYISASQLGVTLASLGLGLVGEPALARLIEPAFGWLRALSDAAFEFFTFVLAFAIVTYVTTVIGELAPKYLAIQRALPL